MDFNVLPSTLLIHKTLSLKTTLLDLLYLSYIQHEWRLKVILLSTFTHIASIKTFPSLYLSIGSFSMFVQNTDHQLIISNYLGTVLIWRQQKNSIFAHTLRYRQHPAGHYKSWRIFELDHVLEMNWISDIWVTSRGVARTDISAL